MKKITYYLMLMFVVFSFNSCEDEDYKDMNITEDTREVVLKEFTGDLSSHIIVSNAKSEVITEADMGETFYLIDNSTAAIDNRTWTITQGSNVSTYTDKMVKMYFEVSGDATISLTSERSSDGKSVTSEIVMPINFIPVTAGIITDPIPGADDVINLKTGDIITYADNSTGLPETFDWKFEGGSPATGDQKNHEVQYQTPGLYSIDYTVSREDNPGEFVTDQIVKTGWINVVQRYARCVRAVATDNKIVIEFTEKMLQDIPAEAKDEFTVTINTNAGGVLTPAVTNVTALDDYRIELTFDDQMYSDDEVLVTFTSAGHLTDATTFGIIELEDEPCVYGHNLLINTDMEDPSKWGYNWNPKPGSEFGFVNENSDQYAIKPYQGQNCMYMIQGSENVSIGIEQGLTFEAGEVFIIAYEAQKLGATGGGGFERRVSLTQWSGGNDAGGNWSSANDPGLNFWKTITKKVVVGDSSGSGGTKGQVGTFYYTLIRYNGSATEPIFIDNFRIYRPNPRP